MTTNNYLQAIDRFEGTSVLCVGDVMLDRYIHGTVTRISPEAPIPILKIDRETMTLGGAGNVVNNIAALGGIPRFATVVGEDQAGTAIIGLLAKQGHAKGVFTDAQRPTTVKTRFVSGSQQLLRADQEVLTSISSEAEAGLIDLIINTLATVQAIVISDYLKGVVTERLVTATISAATKLNLPIIVDSKPQSYRFFKGATVVKPNRRELNLATGMPVDTDDEVAAAALKLIEISVVIGIVATRSEQGMSVISKMMEPIHFRAEAKEVFDVSGAGDTVAATLAMALASGSSLVEAAELANHAAGIVVGKIGTASVRLSELRDAIREQPEQSTHKIKTIDEVADEIERWRARGVKIGFTNGCFDILHPGHIYSLSQARRACDRLIVGLNSDASVKRLKGQSRPVNDELARAQVLAGLEDVDAVVVFPEDTPVNLIHRLRPDVLIKGADYTVEQVAGADFVMSYGGKVVLIQIKEGYSTTNTINRLQA